nr:MAG TPA: hypothetical protein [Caudoviricetes sp.]
MNAVQQIKQKHDMDALLKAIAPRMEENVKRRRQQEAGKRKLNAVMAKAGLPLRVL